MISKIKNLLSEETFALILNLVLAMVIFMICRFLFYAENHTLYSDISSAQWQNILRGGVQFDLTAMLYLNSLLILLFTIPCHLKGERTYRLGRILFVVLNGVGVLMNLADAVYFQFTGRRTTGSIFQEFSAEGNLGSVIGHELINHWYLLLSAILLIAMLYFGYRTPQPLRKGKLPTYYIAKTILFVIAIYLTICGIRGGFGSYVRPITLSNANQYTTKQSETALVLNTPFSVIRTINKKAYPTPQFFKNEELDSFFSPIHQPNDSLPFIKKNVVIIIWESLGREYIGSLNNSFGKNYESYTPFLDSLIQNCLTFQYTFSNGRKSIDAMPSILSSIPHIIEPFIVSNYSLNKVDGIAAALNSKGYHSAFFHGAPNGSMGFEAFAKKIGFKEYYGMTEYEQEKGEGDFDGTWAIWDEPFLQYYAEKMGEFPEPFVTSIFTASSHHPFVVPKEYEDVFPKGELAIHQPMRYTDNAFRKFFETIKESKWYDNTLFVITGDHTNMTNHTFYTTDVGSFCVPVIFFDPSGEIVQKGITDKIAQQIDIMPTILAALHYDEPFVAFGQDLFSTPQEESFAITYNGGIYQFIQNGYNLQFDGEKTAALYALNDSTQQNNLKGLEEKPEMEQKLKAIIQQYMLRMKTDSLTIKVNSAN
jgi:phosphoglycerol transferase MdoB-like AlkP superfamily enzyme